MLRREDISFRAACAVLLLLAVISVAHLLAGAFSAHLRAPLNRSAAPLPTVAPVSKPSLESYAPIVEQGLFGPATKGVLQTVQPKQAQQAQPQAPVSALLLLGTVEGAGRDMFALIARQNPPEERVFRIGEKVFESGVLVRVRKGKAEIRNNGVVTTLSTPDSPGESPASPVQAAVQPGVHAMVRSGSVIDQRALAAMLDAPGKIMSDAKMLPAMKDGKVEGFRASEVKPEGVFAAIGLKNGDVVKRVNDIPLTTPEQAMQAIAGLKGQTSVRIELLRDALPMSLAYEIR